jgi:FkbM family methyltransferase
LKHLATVKIFGIEKILAQENSSYLVSNYEKKGWLKSRAIAKSIDNKDQPLPWFTYSAISFIGNLDLQNKNVLELGSGNSTLWFAKKSANVCSIESNFEYYSNLFVRIPDGVNLLHAENLSTLNQLPNLVTDADIIVIDSTHRVHDTEIIYQHLMANVSKKLEMIIFDNSERYPNIIKSLSEKLDLIQTDFIGLGPINDYEWSTSILINRNFNIKNTRKFTSLSTFPHHVNQQVSDMDKEIGEEYKPIKSYSLNNIDIKLNEIFQNKKNGFYVELGANDGINQSNTFFFEKFFNWSGILIEPFIDNFKACKVNRSPLNHVVNAACVSNSFKSDTMPLMYSNLMTIALKGDNDISDREKHAKSGSKFIKGKNFVFNSPTRTLTSILEESHAPKLIDLLSLDVEGAEIEVLKGLDHSKYRFDYICVESRELNEMTSYLESQSYKLVRSLSNHDYLFEDVSRRY